jgi:hypothetical protein
MRIFNKAAVSMTAVCLLAFGAVVGAGGSAFAGDGGPDTVITGCSADVNTSATGFEPNCEAISGTVGNPTVIGVYVDTDDLAALIKAQPGQGMDASWTLTCLVNGAAVSKDGSYDVTSTSQAPGTIIDLQTLLGSPEPNECSIQNLTVQTALALNPSVLSRHSASGHALAVSGFTIAVAAVADVAVPGAIYQSEGTTGAGAHAELCADDTGNGNAGSKIQGFQCRDDLADAFVRTSSGQLVHNGDCTGVSGDKVILSHCTADKPSQEWAQSTVGSWVRNQSTGSCLTSPSAKAGMQLTVMPCGNKAGQKWTLPAASAAPVLAGVPAASIWRTVRSLKSAVRSQK